MIFGWSGDAVQLKADNPNIEFVLPESGGMLWTDNMQIPVGAPHAYTAEKFIDYIYQPEVQAPIEAYINYICPVKGTKEVLEKTRQGARREPADLPGRGVLDNTYIFRDLKPEEERELDDAFQQADRRVGAGPGTRTMPARLRKAALPYLLLLPGLGWLLLFFAIPLVYMALESLKTGTIDTRLPAHLGVLELHERAQGLQRAVHPLVRVRRARHADRAR